ncbi:MAG: PilT/PilU family type 4a pilus ATPase [Candidatus Omnitrophica bacterium]|nr:PilT/PilU family type 4a pilus ATPase [Candidatus Omnitrophota bacterium]
MQITSIDDIINEALQRGASDIHLKTEKPPYIRINGELIMMEMEPLTKETLSGVVLGMLTDEQNAILKKNKELDFSFRSAKDYQFRVNVCYSQGMIVANLRITVDEIKTLQELGLPQVINQLCKKRKGLILISGTAGSGKTTTLTYMIDYINRTRRCKIITIEDPIEYNHQSKNSLVIQREVGPDTNSFNDALKYALRQDPDVLVIGEMRDLDSISMALTTAETGHLVLSTVHASDAVETINRVIDVFPADRRQQINIQLAGTLLGVVSQSLVPLKNTEGRVLATDVLVTSVAIQNLIHRGVLNEIRGHMDANVQGTSHTLERCLADLIRRDLITKETAMTYTKNPRDLDYFIKAGDAAALNTFSPDQWEELYLRSILIVDRDVKQRTQIEEKLRAVGFKSVNHLGKNKETMDKILHSRPDIVVLDIEHEFKPTVDFCKEIKALSWSPKLILLTESLVQLNQASELAQSVGADGLAVKTNEAELLVKAMTRLEFPPVPPAAEGV